MLTEEQAKEKWCPFARVANSPTVAGNRYPFDTDYSEKHAFATCLASDCVAWRWADHWEPGEQIWTQGGGNYTTEKPTPSTGYCGLAGKPEG